MWVDRFRRLPVLVLAGLVAASLTLGLPAQGQNASRPQLTPEERGDIFMARKEYADAVDYFLRALKETGSDRAELWNKLGIAYQQQMDYRAARNAYRRAIHLREDLAEPWNNLGTIFYLENKAKKSLKYYQKAVQLSPSSAPFHLNLGTSYYKLKKVGLCVAEYRTALSLDPSVLTEHSTTGTSIEARAADARFYFYLAKVLASLGRSNDAIRYLRRAFEEGYTDQKELEKDPDFQKISANPAYIELIQHPPLAIHD